MGRDELREEIGQAIFQHPECSDGWVAATGMADAVLTVLDHERAARRAAFEEKLEDFANLNWEEGQWFERLTWQGADSTPAGKKRYDDICTRVKTERATVIEAAGWLGGEGMTTDRTLRVVSDDVVRLSVNVTPEVAKAIQQHAESKGVTVAELVRNALATERFLHENAKEGGGDE